jgi:hypothetical protein
LSTTYTPGRYLAQIREQGFGLSEARGTPYLFLLVKILARVDEQGQQQSCPQYEREYRRYLSAETGAGILQGDLHALGIQVTDLTQLDPATPGHISLVGREIEVFCEIESYKGKQQERWGIPRPRKKLDVNALRSLSDQFRHIFAGGHSQPKPSAEPQAPTPNAEPN